MNNNLESGEYGMNMFNANSPIINNMMGAPQGMYSPGYIPPNPIGNIVNIGNGYNNMGGYYNNNYSYYNPYLIAQQQQAMMAQQREEERRQSDIMKLISTKVNKAGGYEVTDEFLNQYNPVYEQPQNEDLEITNRLANIFYNGSCGDQRLIAGINARNALYDSHKQRFSDDMSMFEFFERGGELYREALEQKHLAAQRDVSRLYNSSQYNELIGMHKNSSNYYNSIFRGGNQGKEITIDDLEVKLPDQLQSNNEYQRRKQEFINKLVGGGNYFG